MHRVDELVALNVEGFCSVQELPEEPRFARLADRALPALVPIETSRQRWTWLGVLAGFLALYAFALATFWAPADGGVDQNAYLVGGKQLARNGSMRFEPAHPYGYVGHMFIIPENDPSAYYPKYPIGLPLLYAAVIKAAGWERGATLAFAVSPVCAVLAVAGMFFLARAVAASFAAMLAAVALAGCEVMWSLANVANSHAASVAFVVWGMYLLIKWWQRGGVWLGVLAGFALGFACLIRYTEGLLIIPIVLAVALRVRWRDWRSLLRNASPILGWTVPIAAQLLINRFTIGDWTGYDSSNESEFGRAFTWEKFTQTWELMLRTFHDQGLFFTLPVCVAGIGLLFARSWRMALLVLAWLVPGVALYTSYYWSPDRGVSYARFFLTFFPALLLGLAVCIRQGFVGTSEGSRRVVMTLTAGVIVAIATGVGTWRVVGSDEGGPGGMSASMLGQHRNRLSLATTGAMVREYVPSGSVVFTEAARGLDGAPNYLQFLVDGDLFTAFAFDTRGARGMRGPGGPAGQDQDNPTPMQPRRRERMRGLYAEKSERELVEEQQTLADQALSGGRRVFFLGTQANVLAFQKKFLPADRYELVTVQRWKDSPVSATATRRQGNFGGGPGFGRDRDRDRGGPPPDNAPRGAEMRLVEFKALPPRATSQPIPPVVLRI